MKKYLALLLALVMCLSLFSACGSKSADPGATTQPAPTEPTAAWSAGPEALQGKKIIFVGNSYTYWGQTVLYKTSSTLGQAERSDDQGYFYQLCKENGIDVSVTNWTFGGHDITQMFGQPCTKTDSSCQGEQHEYFIQDRYFDYVCIQPYRELEYQGDIVAHLQYIMNFFREANPNVCFLLLIPHMAPERSYRWLQDVDALKGENVRICNWGGMLHDICQGNVQVPGATLPYLRSSFVCGKDDHHENLLAGYITTLFVYCTITGESAQGQPYDFCSDSERNPLFNLETFWAENYPGGGTNFMEIFRSEADMAGLQQLVDTYLEQ